MLIFERCEIAMQNKNIVLGLVFLVIFFATPVAARETIKDYALFCTQERVNGQLFSRRVEVVRGVKAASYQVDEQEVQLDVFEDQLIRAEGQERRVELRGEAEKIGARERESQQTRALIIKKLLTQLVGRCKKDLFLLEKFNLERYLAFAPETLTREDYERVVTQLIPAAEAALAATDMATDLAVLERLYRDLEPHERRVNAFVFATIRQATERCDDPRVLKELLAVVSQ